MHQQLNTIMPIQDSLSRTWFTRCRKHSKDRREASAFIREGEVLVSLCLTGPSVYPDSDPDPPHTPLRRSGTHFVPTRRLKNFLAHGGG